MKHLTDKPLVLLDFSNLFCRYYYGMNPSHSSSGVPTHAIRGWFNLLRTLKTEFEGSQIISMYDNKSKHRFKLYPNYKGNREEKPYDFVVQQGILHQINDKMGIPSIIHSDHEADDLISSVAKVREKSGLVSFIMSNDKDFAQCVSDRTFQVRFDNKRNKGVNPSQTWGLLDENGVNSYFGLKPSQIVDYLSLLGDSADNIPGVYGVGEVTARKLLNAYPDIESIIANLDKLTPKVREAISAYEETLNLNRKLITLISDIDFIELETSIDLKSASELLQSLDLHSESVILDQYKNGIL